VAERSPPAIVPAAHPRSHDEQAFPRSAAPSPAVCRPPTPQRGGARRTDNLMGYLFIAPWLVAFAFTLIPIIASFLRYFTNYDG
jgi:hypothetical protein